MLAPLPLVLEPLLQLMSRLGFQNTFHHIHPVVSTGMTGKVEGASQRPSFWIVGSEHHPSHPGLHQCSGTHRARLQRDQECAVGESPASPQPCRPGQGHQFRVAEGILLEVAAIAAPAHGPPLSIEHHGGHGNLPFPTHLIGPPQQPLHPFVPGIRPHGASDHVLSLRL